MGQLPKRHFYNERDYFLDLEKKKIILQEDFHKKLLDKKLWGKFGFKKIGGSSIGDILNTDEYKSSFSAFANLAWIGLPVLDRKYIDAGIAIEPKVINVLKNNFNLDIETYDPIKYNYDYFSGKDEIIGGIPDGYIKDKKVIIEIKTTGEKNYNNWNSFGVPISYQKQGQLYAYLMGVKEFWIVATFLKEEDYLIPEDFPISKRVLKNYKFNFDQEMAKDDIKKVKDWYLYHTQKGESPEFDIVKDHDLIEYLKCKNENEYKVLLNKWKEEGKLKLNY